MVGTEPLGGQLMLYLVEFLHVDSGSPSVIR